MNQKIMAVIAAGSMLFGGAGVYAGINLLEMDKPQTAQFPRRHKLTLNGIKLWTKSKKRMS